MFPSRRRDSEYLHVERGEYLVADLVDSSYDLDDYVQSVVGECRSGFDNVTMVTSSREGLGKSLLAASLSVNIEEKNGRGWDWHTNMVFYDWDDFAPRYEQPTPYLVVDVDEAVEMLFSRMSAVAAQKRVVQDLVTGRFMNKHVFLCAPSLLWFDPVIRYHKAHYWLHLIWDDNPRARRAYVCRRRFSDWPTRTAIWDAIGFIEYPLPVPDWFLTDYDKAKREAYAAYRDKLRKTRKGRERGPCEACGETWPLNVVEGRKLCWRCRRREDKAKVALRRT